jgi:hypothetical protein
MRHADRPRRRAGLLAQSLKALPSKEGQPEWLRRQAAAPAAGLPGQAASQAAVASQAEVGVEGALRPECLILPTGEPLHLGERRRGSGQQKGS